MTPLISLILVFITQIIGYIFFYSKGIKGWRYVLFVILLFLCILVLPDYFIRLYRPKDGLDSTRCGMVDLDVFLFFWMYGVSGAILTHVLFWLGYKIKESK